jgi:hypothetical protein
MSSQNNAATSTQGAATEQTNPGAAASNNDQNAGVGASGANSNQNAGQTSATTSEQNGNQVRHISDMDQNAPSGQANGKLPQTASPLPLLGLLGLGLK